MDTIDVKIINHLENDGRISYSKLSRILGISVSTIAKRISHLLNSGIISIRAIPNRDTIGLHASSLIGMNISMDSIDDICATLKGQFNVNLMTTTFGRFNFLIAVQFQTRGELENFISSKFLRRSDIYETQVFFGKELRKPKIENLSDVYDARSSYTIDEIDQKIIDLLIEDGRANCVYVGKKLDISTSLAHKRIRRLLTDDLIRVRARPNPTKVGYTAVAFIFIRADPARVDDICRNLYPLKEVTSIMTLMNGYDIYISTVARDLKSLYDFVKLNMTHSKGIISVETLISGDIIKRYYGLTNVNWVISSNNQ